MSNAANCDARIKVEEIPAQPYTLMVPGCGQFVVQLTGGGRAEFVKGLLDHGYVEIAGHVVFASGMVLAKGAASVIQQAPAGLKIG